MSSKKIDDLQERIKELGCLYEISNIAATSKGSLDDTLQSIVEVLPKAWLYPKDAVAQLTLGTKTFNSGSVPPQSVSQKSPIEVNNEYRGVLAIHYDAQQLSQRDFLSEEKSLLNTLAIEIGQIISRSEQMEREELLNRKLEHSDRLAILGEITAGIAHELNTPLGNILGFSQLIQDKTTDNQIKLDIEKIINSALHAREVVKKLMFFSCEMPQQMSVVAIDTLIEEALNLLKISLKNANVSVKFIKAENKISARVDPVQFTQVVFNLLINAIHASKAGKEITIKLDSNSNELKLSIEDQGHGMSETVKEKIFEPFFTTKPTGEGSGLGLSVVHGIVKSHGGNIKVTSKENTGSTFIVKIPLKRNNE